MTKTIHRSEQIWLISKHYNDRVYFVAGVDEKKNSIVWGPTREQAIKFLSHADLYKFIDNYLKGRTDIIVVKTTTIIKG